MNTRAAGPVCSSLTLRKTLEGISVPFSDLDGSGKPIAYAMVICLRRVRAIARKIELKKFAADCFEARACSH
jgi:hypothetical protein